MAPQLSAAQGEGGVGFIQQAAHGDEAVNLLVEADFVGLHAIGIQRAGVVAAFVAAGGRTAWSAAAGERMNVACIGVGGKGSSDSDNASLFGKRMLQTLEPDHVGAGRLIQSES